MKPNKKLKLYLSIYLCIILSVLTFFNFSTYAYADVPDTQKAVVHNMSTWSTLPWNYNTFKKYWTISDPTGIPSSTTSDPNYFYTNLNDGKFYLVEGKELIQGIMTKGLQIVMKQNNALSFIQSYLSSILGATVQGDGYIQGAVYDDNDNFLGYALNDITGCYYYDVSDPANQPAINVPTNQTNNVYNYYNYYLDQNPTYPDFITVYPASLSFTLSHYKPLTGTEHPQYAETVNSNITNAYNNYKWLASYMLTPNSAKTSFEYIGFANNYWNSYGEAFIIPDAHFIQATSGYTFWNNICDEYNLTKDDNTLLFSDIYSGVISKSDAYIRFNVFDNQTNNQITTYQRLNLVSNNTDTFTKNEFYLGFGTSNNGRIPFDMFGGNEPYTIYKDINAYNGIKDKTYTPDTFYGTNYYNYNTSNDNSITITYTNTDNSSTINQTIYEDASDNYYNYEDNSTVNNTEIGQYIESLVIINYPGGNPGPTPPNPEDPDNPSDDPLDPDNPSGILDAILDALGRFFSAIGRILATILAGLLDVVDNVLEAIAGIMENMTGVTDFLSALFGWLPDPVPQVLAAAISVTILFALIRFIRG